MLAKRIVPCLDVKAGRVVKGVNFVDLKDAGDPVELAQAYNQAGADELVFLDITATHEDRDIIYDVVYRTAEQVFIPLTVGGGVGSLETIKKLLRVPPSANETPWTAALSSLGSLRSHAETAMSFLHH